MNDCVYSWIGTCNCNTPCHLCERYVSVNSKTGKEIELEHEETLKRGE
jgi:hypothetical protein